MLWWYHLSIFQNSNHNKSITRRTVNKALQPTTPANNTTPQIKHTKESMQRWYNMAMLNIENAGAYTPESSSTTELSVA
jgi:hypothetical protein